MKESAYRLVQTIVSPSPLNQIPEVAFTPDGSQFAVTYQHSNEVVLFDSKSRSVIRVYNNPAAKLDYPHGVVIIGKYMVVSNTHGKTRPSTFTSYRLDAPSAEPVSIFETPFPHLREAHSLSCNNGGLVVSYCHNTDKCGAIVSYRFDGHAGTITDTLDIRKISLEKFGDPKGVAFNHSGTSVYFTYSTPKRMTGLPNQTRRFKAAGRILRERGVMAMIQHLSSRVKKRTREMLGTEQAIRNGIAIFDLSEKGEFSEHPVQVFQRSDFCRLENIAIIGDTLALSDTINGVVSLYNLLEDPHLKAPEHIITENITLPHGAKLSPDKNMLVVTNYGLKVQDQVIHWNTPAANSSNRVLVYELNAT